MVSFDPPNCLNLDQMDTQLLFMVHLTGFAAAEFDFVVADFGVVDGATPLNCSSRDVVGSCLMLITCSLGLLTAASVIALSMLSLLACFFHLP